MAFTHVFIIPYILFLLVRAMAVRQRARFCEADVNSDDLINAICLVARRPQFLKYGEALDCKVNQKRVAQVKPIWVAAHKLWSKLSFTQKYVEDLMLKVEVRQRELWGKEMPPKVLKSWQVATARQFRAMARHVSQALIKKRPWAVSLIADGVAKGEVPKDEAEDTDEDEDTDACEGEEGAEEEDPKESDEIVEATDEEQEENSEGAGASTVEPLPPKPCLKKKGSIGKTAHEIVHKISFVGYDTEHEQAWRQRHDGPKEWAVELILPEKDSDPIMAKFADGELLEVKGITAKGVKATEAARKFQKGHATLWEGVTSDGYKVTITRKEDRTPLLILYRYGGETEKNGKLKQLCQVALKVFGDVEDPDRHGCMMSHVQSCHYRKGRVGHQGLLATVL
jgi:hypothetical protein